MANVGSLFKTSGQRFLYDRAPRMAAALAYYTAFSLAPLLVIVTLVAGVFVGEETAQGEIANQIESTIGPQAAEVAEAAIRNAKSIDGSLWSTLISVGALLFGATVVFLQLQDALNKIWDVPVEQRGSGLKSLLLKRVLSLGMVVASGFLLLVSLIISTALSALGQTLAQYVPVSSTFMRILSLGTSVALITVIFALIYRYLPDTDVAWGEVWWGALLTSLLFTIGRWLLGIYLGVAAPASVYGAAGSFAIILLWVYYSAQIILFGAEFTHAYAERQRQPQPATAT